MKKYIFLITALFLSVFLVACNDDKVLEEENNELNSRLTDVEHLGEYMELSKLLSSNIFSNTTLDELGSYFKTKESQIDKELYANRFNLDNELNHTYYLYERQLDTIDLIQSYADYVKDKDNVTIVLISRLYFIGEAHNHDEIEHDGIEQLSDTKLIMESYTFNRETNKLVDYVSYYE